MVSNGTKATAQEMNAMRAAVAAPRPKTDPEVGSGGAGDARVAAAVADWRRTECVIEGPDSAGLYRIRHAPTGLCWGSWAGNFQDPHADPLCFMFFYDAPGSGRVSGTGEPADKILASIPDSARPKAPNTEAALLAADAEPRTFVGNELHNVEVTSACPACTGKKTVSLSDPLCEWHRSFVTAAAGNVRPVTAPEQAQIDATLDAFGIGNPQAGEGAPLAPSPAPLDRETADAFFRAGYSAAMCEAIAAMHRHFPSSMARAGATIDLCEKGSNPPVPATLGPGGVK